MSKQWFDKAFLTAEYELANFQLDIDNFTVSGFSNGAFLASNLVALYNQHINGAAILSGSGPCAVREVHPY